MGYFTLILALVLLYIQGSTAKKCRALTMSGGGDKGPYQAAVFSELVNLLPLEEVTYDVLVGVSAGALNSLSLTPFEPHQAREAADFAMALWSTIPQAQAWQFWPGGIFAGIFEEKGVLDITPGMDFVAYHFQNRTVNRKVTFTSTDANTGAYNPIDYEPTGTWPEGIIKSVFASCIIPFAFGQVQIGDKVLLDGGVKWKLDVLSAVRRCREIVDDDNDIIVDMILCANPVVQPVASVKGYSALAHYLRANEMRDYYQTLSDYNSSIAMFPNVTFRYLIAPSESVTSGLIPLEYSDEQIERCFRVGKKDAENAVKLGPGGYAKTIMDYYNKVQQGETPDFDQMITSSVKKVQGEYKEESK